MKGDGTNITLTSNPMLSKNQRRCSYRPCTVLPDLCKVGLGLRLCKSGVQRLATDAGTNVWGDLDLNTARRLGEENSMIGEVGEDLW